MTTLTGAVGPGSWSAQAKAYLTKLSDRDGPVIGKVVADYANAMSQLYLWLFGERAAVKRTPPERFRMTAPPVD